MIEVTERVPADLSGAIAAEARPVVVHLAAPAELAGEALAGWEIGAATAALLAGAVDVTGVDPVRLARVRTVVGHLQGVDAPRGEPATPTASEPAR